jgi:hypothetical protein
MDVYWLCERSEIINFDNLMVGLVQACRMAVELGLNRYHAKPPAHESEFQLRERRNRERTYLVLFVHDRSLSMQTGRHWMLPEVKHFYFPKTTVYTRCRMTS